MPTPDRRFDDAAFLAALDQLIARLRSRHTSIGVRRIRPEENPSGDDWIWYFTHPASAVTVQLDPDWEHLFLVDAEPGSGLAELDTVDEAVDAIEGRLGLRALNEPSKGHHHDLRPNVRWSCRAVCRCSLRSQL